MAASLIAIVALAGAPSRLRGWITPVFTGLDLIVIFLVLGAILYATSPGGGGGSEMKPEPLTLLVVIIVMGMIVMSFI